MNSGAVERSPPVGGSPLGGMPCFHGSAEGHKGTGQLWGAESQPLEERAQMGCFKGGSGCVSSAGRLSDNREYKARL